MAVYYIVLEATAEIEIFFIPLAFDAPVRGSLSEYCRTIWCGKLEWWGHAIAKRFGDKFSRLDRIPACDRQTDIPITDILPQHNTTRYAYASRGKNWRMFKLGWPLTLLNLICAKIRQEMCHDCFKRMTVRHRIAFCVLHKCTKDEDARSRTHGWRRGLEQEINEAQLTWGAITIAQDRAIEAMEATRWWSVLHYRRNKGISKAAIVI